MGETLPDRPAQEKPKRLKTFPKPFKLNVWFIIALKVWILRLWDDFLVGCVKREVGLVWMNLIVLNWKCYP